MDRKKASNQSTFFAIVKSNVTHYKPSKPTKSDGITRIRMYKLHHFYPWSEQSPCDGQTKLLPFTIQHDVLRCHCFSFFPLLWCKLIWSIHKRVQKPEPAEATTQMLLHLHPSFQHPNPMGICMTWIVEFSPGHPCLHGSWADECWAYKPFPAQNNSRFKILKMELIM